MTRFSRFSKCWRGSTLALLVTVAGFGFPAGVAAQFSQFDWTLEGSSDGSGTLTATTMQVVGPDSGPFGACFDGQDTYFETTADQTGTIDVFLDWDNVDVGYHWDFPAYYVNGVRTIIGSMGTSFPFSTAFSFDVQAGDRFGLGAYSVDCINGPGTSDFSLFTFTPEPECFLVIGAAPGDSPFVGASHAFDTQVGPVVQDSYPVLLDDVPEFVLPWPSISGVAAGGAGGKSLVEPPKTPRWLLDGQISVQVVMWNPDVFPGQPEQYSAGLSVQVMPDGKVIATPYGTPLGGLDVWAEVDTNALGQTVIRFPFSIDGL